MSFRKIIPEIQWPAVDLNIYVFGVKFIQEDIRFDSKTA
jgi:hypothetical protein